MASRRAAEEWIKAGRVSVNGQVVTEMGSKVDPARDTVQVDGRPVKVEAAPLTLMLHKPSGYISSRHDPAGAAGGDGAAAGKAPGPVLPGGPPRL